MKQMKRYFISLTVLILFVPFMSIGQTKTYTWDSYKTKFKVPSDFVVDESTGNKWVGHNDHINLSIYPRKDENLTHREMSKAVYDWAVDNEVRGIGDEIELDTEKLHGYWGYLYEGKKNGFEVATMLIVDPDYPDISLYIWVSYDEEYSDEVIDMLKSFTPN